ncbi:hypothetical protein ART_1581 [Arthrobacter sp. PAMC 25486]|uniref:hypothetical protein n=1 Tax=Arthrobacter sp. PAMC 25486 TaxID=1494608 RepID=UPI0005360CB9|nr:hypothetical protein [Arthrobacter sp. PAMC 25486]AIY01180.1 hypothetical protein ART_1581 [Arthrobacter sp. PAMC 25486]
MTVEEEAAKAEHEAKFTAYNRAPKFRHITRELEGVVERESYIYSTPDGAVELWRRPETGGLSWSSTGHMGGVEIHSPKPLYANQKQNPGYCAHVWGGKCWTSGSSMAFDQYEEEFGQPDYIKAELARWHSNEFDSPEEDES